eukprot:Opistho-2@25187
MRHTSPSTPVGTMNLLLASALFAAIVVLGLCASDARAESALDVQTTTTPGVINSAGDLESLKSVAQAREAEFQRRRDAAKREMKRRQRAMAELTNDYVSREKGVLHTDMYDAEVRALGDQKKAYDALTEQQTRCRQSGRCMP